MLPDDELIISDDGSTDNTIDIISSFNDNRIIGYHFKDFIVDRIFSIEHRDNRDEISFRRDIV